MSKYDFEIGAKVALIGSTGGIGSAVLEELKGDENIATIYAFARSDQDIDDDKIVTGQIDITDESSIKEAAGQIDGKLDMVFIATGILHGQGLEPEKAIKDLEINSLDTSYRINAIGPALVGKHFLPLMRDDRKSVFAALSARVGSISDNNTIGGWYAYRMAKAALNMALKNFAIEIGRKNKKLVVTGLQPGTVDTPLSEPFQQYVKDDKLFTPEFSARHLLQTLNTLTAKDSGKLYDWNGEEFAP